MKEFELQRVYEYPINPWGSKNSTDKGFISIAKGNQGGTHCCCFRIKYKKANYFLLVWSNTR